MVVFCEIILRARARACVRVCVQAVILLENAVLWVSFVLSYRTVVEV